MLRPLLTIELSCDRFEPDTAAELLLAVGAVAAGVVGDATGAVVLVVVLAVVVLGACGG